MSDPDSNSNPVELPAGRGEETSEQQREFDLGFEYGKELLRLENKLDLLNADIHSLKYPLGNPEKNLDRMAQRKELEDKAAEVQRRIDFIRQWFATKPTNLDGIPSDTDTPPADTSTLPPDTVPTSTGPAKSAIRPRKHQNRARYPGAFYHEVLDTFEEIESRTPTEPEMWEFAMRMETATIDRKKTTDKKIVLFNGTEIDLPKMQRWYRKAFKEINDT